MKKLLPLLSLPILALVAFGQSSTPNVGLQLPAVGSNNWYVPLAYNFTKIDLLLSGGLLIPTETISGNLTVNGTITAGSIQGPGGSSLVSSQGSPLNSLAYYSGTGTSTIISGLQLTGIPVYSPSKTPRPGTYADIVGLWASTCGSQYLKGDGTCGAGGGTTGGTLAGDVTGPLSTNIVTNVHGAGGTSLFVGPNSTYGRSLHVAPFAVGDQTGMDFDGAATFTQVCGTTTTTGQINRWQMQMGSNFSWSIYDNTGCRNALQLDSVGSFHVLPGLSTDNAEWDANIANTKDAFAISPDGSAYENCDYRTGGMIGVHCQNLTYNNLTAGYNFAPGQQYGPIISNFYGIDRSIGVRDGFTENFAWEGAEGDLQQHASYIGYRAGVTAAADESIHAWWNFNAGEIVPSIGTVSFTGANGVIALSPASGNGDLGVGQIVIDTTKKVANTATANSGQTVTLSTAVAASTNGTLTSNVTIPQGAGVDVGALVKGVTMNYAGANPSGQVFTVSGSSQYETFVPTNVTAITNGYSFDAVFRHPHNSNDTIATGGLAGYCYEVPSMTYNLHPSANPYANIPDIRVEDIYSSTANSVTIGHTQYGTSNNTFLAGYHSAVNIYPCARIASVQDPSQNGAYSGTEIVLAPTPVTFAANDGYEATNLIAGLLQTVSWKDGYDNAFATFVGSHYNHETGVISGAGTNSGTLNEYYSGASNLAYTSLHGDWGPLITMQYGPEAAPGNMENLGGATYLFGISHLETPVSVFMFATDNQGISTLNFDPNSGWTFGGSQSNFLINPGRLSITTDGQVNSAQASGQMDLHYQFGFGVIGTRYYLDVNNVGYVGSFGYADQNGLANTQNPITNVTNFENTYFLDQRGHHFKGVGNSGDINPSFDFDASGDLALNGGLTAVSATVGNSPVCTQATGCSGAGAGGSAVHLDDCQPFFGGETTAYASGPHIMRCENNTGSTWAITAADFYTDNSGTSTVTATNGAGTAILGSALTGSPSRPQGAIVTNTIANGDVLILTVNADGASKQLQPHFGLCYPANTTGCTPATATVANVNFNPSAGTYNTTQSVALSSATSGASIYYTTDGTTPTTASTLYSGPISVASTETIEALATESGYANSAVTTATYTIQPIAATPTASPVGGSYSTAQTVTLADATTGATIHYTTDGTTPTSSSATYSTAITTQTTGSETIKAIATVSGYTNSDVMSQTYNIAGATYTDNFSGTSLASPPWTIDAGTFVISSGNLYANTNGAYNQARYTGGAFTNKQWGCATLSAQNTAQSDDLSLGIQMTATMQSGYYAQIKGGDAVILKNGSVTNGNFVAATVGHEYCIFDNAGAITVTDSATPGTSGTTVLSWTDSTPLTGGVPGFYSYYGTNYQTYANFRAGSN